MIKYDKIVSIEEFETDETYDIWNREADAYAPETNEGNFLVDNIVVHNSIPEAIANRDSTSNEWKKKLHPLMLKELEETYGVICYQEQLTNLWQNIADFTGPEAQHARIAVAKKQGAAFKQAQEKWLTNASKKIGDQAAKEWFDKQANFARYAFNKCLSKDTLLTDVQSGDTLTVEGWYNSEVLPTLHSWDGGCIIDKCVSIHDTGTQEIFEIEFDNGQKERVTELHKFLCVDGSYRTVREIFVSGLEIANADVGGSTNTTDK